LENAGISMGFITTPNLYKGIFVAEEPQMLCALEVHP